MPLIHAIGLTNLTFSEHDERFITLLGFLLRERPGAVIDVGANIGRFLLYIVSVDRQAQYVGCEPNLDCCYYIEDLIRANDLRQHSILPLGFSDKSATMELMLNDDFDVCATVVTEFYAQNRLRNRKLIYLETGDNVLSDLGLDSISLIKIDVEGGELDALRGLTRTIDTFRPMLIVEVAPYAHLETTDPAADAANPDRRRVAAFRKKRIGELEGFLRDARYGYFKINDGNRLQALDSLDPGTSTDLNEMDYLCVPSEYANELIHKYES